MQSSQYMAALLSTLGANVRHTACGRRGKLLLDPAVVREFERLRGAAEAKAQEVRKLQEELQAVNFSQESKAGRLLMAKCRALQARAPFDLCPAWRSPLATP